MEYFDKKNVEFYSFLESTFALKKCKTWKQVSENITLEKIKLTYKYFAKLFPLSENHYDQFVPSNKFITLHYGNLRGNSIINDIVRFSLYSEQILVFHPLQNPSITNPQFNPIKKPKYWLADFISSLHFYIVLQKWVSAGIVKLIINPIAYKPALQKKFHGEAIARVKGITQETYEKYKSETADHLAEHFANFFGTRSLEWLKNMLLNIQNPKFTDADAEEFSKKIKEAYSNRNPLYENLKVPNEGGMITDKMGANVEEINHILNLTGSNVFTCKNSCWDMLKSINNNETWTKINYSYSKIDLNFLNNVDTSFVLSLRQDGRLSQLRNELKEIFSEFNNIDVAKISELKIAELNERLLDSIKSSEAEWQNIKDRAENARRYWFTASVGIPIIQHEATIATLIGSALWFLNSIKGENIDLKHYRATNPMSVFIDLKHKDEGFFSDLKNCLF